MEDEGQNGETLMETVRSWETNLKKWGDKFWHTNFENRKKRDNLLNYKTFKLYKCFR